MTTDLDELEDRRERLGLADHIGSAFASVPRPDPPLTEGRPLNEDVEVAAARASWACVGDSRVDSLHDSVFTLLMPLEGRATDEDFERRVAPLDRSQRSALTRYVDWCLDGESGLPGHERALAYWHEL